MGTVQKFTEGITDEPKGIVPIAEIENLTCLSNLDFFFTYSGRKFELRADTLEVKNHWIEALEFLIEHNKQMSPGKGNRMINEKRWKLSRVDTSEREQIKLESETKLMASPTTPSLLNIYKISNDDILDAKGISEYLDKIDSSFLEKRIMMGYCWLYKGHKRRRNYYQLRWFILVSAKPIRKDCEMDEGILLETLLPPWMELETIYYFDDKEILKNTSHSGSIPLIECIDAVSKDSKLGSSNEFKFKIEMDDRIFTLRSKLITDRNKWVEAIKMSKATAKQQKKSRNGLKKNIDPLITTIDKEGVEKLKEKILNDYANIISKFSVESLDELDGILDQVEALSREMLSTIDACLAYDPPRKDIVQEYILIYHENICKALKSFYEKNHPHLQNLELMFLINWLNKHYHRLEPYGFEDKRLTNSIKILAKVFGKKILKTDVQIIFNIVSELRDSRPLENIDGLKITHGPYDLFKIINETLETYNRCRHKQIAVRILKTIKALVIYYQVNLEIIMTNLEFTIDIYVGFSNDTLIYKKSFDELISKTQGLTRLTRQEIEKYLVPDDLLRKFAKIGEKAFEKIADMAFKNFTLYFKPNFMELKMNEILQKIFGSLAEITMPLHENFARKVWRLCFEKLVLSYTQCLLSLGQNVKFKQISELIDKLSCEKEEIQDAFRNVVDKTQLTTLIKGINDLQEFLEASPDLIPIVALTLKQTHGIGFNISTVKVLLNLRIDMSRSEKSSVLDECKQVLLKYRDSKQERKKTIYEFFDKLQVVHDDDDIQEEDSTPSDKDGKNEEKREKDQLIRWDTLPEKENSENQSEKSKAKSLEGYLEKKSLTGWKKRYFAIKNGKLYWGKNDACRKAKDSIEILSIKKCEACEERFFTLTLDKKFLKLKTKSKEERDRWVGMINGTIKDLEIEKSKIQMDTKAFAIISGDSLFTDYEPEWYPSESEKDILLRKEKTKPNSSNKNLNEKEDSELKNDLNRRKTIVWKDTATDSSSKTTLDSNLSPNLIKIQESQPSDNQAPASGRIIDTFLKLFDRR